ncbi:hypothetical protein BN2476_750109 [Paraburkholderia piptadeniae]|uniref:Uncharacterized protein n=1 Tax=Paraburkholderia piptadeniae TaxID=1701573 RepID=A0A1N7SS33_9BURK|nr:hypothetical protein BN2476_750109 [Paraburkholderia piptadeniae]
MRLGPRAQIVYNRLEQVRRNYMAGKALGQMTRICASPRVSSIAPVRGVVFDDNAPQLLISFFEDATQSSRVPDCGVARLAAIIHRSPINRSVFDDGRRRQRRYR